MMLNPISNRELIRTWMLPYAARLGSSVRSQGLYLEIRALLPKWAQKSLTVKGGELTLSMPEGADHDFAEASAVICKALETIESRAVIPREIEDILGISSTERRRWLADGRLPSSGTRTVKLRGRAKITFHVFEPAVVEDILDRGLVDAWRADDAERAIENRRRAAWKAKLARQKGTAASPQPESAEHEDRFKLRGWAEFERDGLLR